MNRKEKLYVARMAYKEIKQVIDKWEKSEQYPNLIYACWDECISVDDELFHHWELKDHSKFIHESKEYTCEFGSNFPIGFANVTMHDSEGNEIEIPVCEHCSTSKCCCMGNEAYQWICMECGK